MDTNLLILGFFKLCYLGILFFIFTYGCLHFMQRRLKSYNNTPEKSVGTLIIVSALVISSVVILYPTSEALGFVFQFLTRQTNGSDLALGLMKYTAYFMTLSFGFFLVTLIIGSFTFKILYKDSFIAIAAENDIAGSIFFGVILVCLAFIAINGMALFIDAMLPYPEIPGFS